MMLNISIRHFNVSNFQQFWYFPLSIIFSLNCTEIAKDPIIRKIIEQIRTYSQTPRGFELHEFNQL